jgi:hypothetical protein
MIEALRRTEPSPRVRMAIHLYTSGVCGTKREASAAAGLHPNYLTMISNSSEPVQRLMDTLTSRIEDETVDSSAVLRTLGRKGIAKIYSLMETAAKEDVQLKAAQDLADRSPETQKTQRLEVSGLSLGASDAKELARALVESAHENRTFAHIAIEGLDEVQMVETPTLVPSHLQLVKRSDG